MGTTCVACFCSSCVPLCGFFGAQNDNNCLLLTFMCFCVLSALYSMSSVLKGDWSALTVVGVNIVGLVKAHELRATMAKEADVYVEVQEPVNVRIETQCA